MTDIKKALTPKKHTNPAIKVPVCYHEDLVVFSQKEADKLVEHQPYNHKIILEEGKQPGFRPLYGMSQNKLLVLQKYLKKHLSKGFIKVSSSPTAVSIIFVKKSGSSLYFYINH